jgi:hypothetical protein
MKSLNKYGHISQQNQFTQRQTTDDESRKTE